MHGKGRNNNNSNNDKAATKTIAKTKTAKSMLVNEADS